MVESKVTFRVQDIVPQLVAYGEQEASEKLETFSDDALHEIGVLAFRYYLVPKTILNKAICLGVVEYIEGSPRELKRKRRVFNK